MKKIEFIGYHIRKNITNVLSKTLFCSMNIVTTFYFTIKLYFLNYLVNIIGKYLTFAKQDLTVKILVEPERM